MSQILPTLASLYEERVCSDFIEAIKSQDNSNVDVTDINASTNDTESSVVTCGICFDEFPSSNVYFQLCQDPVCKQSVACTSCLKYYFEGIVNNGFAGACAPMKCPFHPKKLVSSTIWKQIIAEEVSNTLIKRARAVLSIRCYGCEVRRDMWIPDKERPTLSVSTPNDISFFDKNVIERFLTVSLDTFQEMRFKFLSGDLEPAKAIALIDSFVSKGLEKGTKTGAPCSSMLNILHSLNDPERESALHAAYLRKFPDVHSTCCHRQLCYRCHIRQFHNGITCEEYQASKATHEDVLPCPQCGLQLTKGDGCNSVSCFCGKQFDWSSELRKLHQNLAKAFENEISESGALPPILSDIIHPNNTELKENKIGEVCAHLIYHSEQHNIPNTKLQTYFSGKQIKLTLDKMDKISNGIGVRAAVWGKIHSQQLSYGQSALFKKMMAAHYPPSFVPRASHFLSSTMTTPNAFLTLANKFNASPLSKTSSETIEMESENKKAQVRLWDAWFYSENDAKLSLSVRNALKFSKTPNSLTNSGLSRRAYQHWKANDVNRKKANEMKIVIQKENALGWRRLFGPNSATKALEIIERRHLGLPPAGDTYETLCFDWLEMDPYSRHEILHQRALNFEKDTMKMSSSILDNYNKCFNGVCVDDVSSCSAMNVILQVAVDFRPIHDRNADAWCQLHVSEVKEEESRRFAEIVNSNVNFELFYQTFFSIPQNDIRHMTTIENNKQQEKNFFNFSQQELNNLKKIHSIKTAIDYEFGINDIRSNRYQNYHSCTLSTNSSISFITFSKWFQSFQLQNKKEINEYKLQCWIEFALNHRHHEMSIGLEKIKKQEKKSNQIVRDYRCSHDMNLNINNCLMIKKEQDSLLMDKTKQETSSFCWCVTHRGGAKRCSACQIALETACDVICNVQNNDLVLSKKNMNCLSAWMQLSGNKEDVEQEKIRRWESYHQLDKKDKCGDSTFDAAAEGAVDSELYNDLGERMLPELEACYDAWMAQGESSRIRVREAMIKRLYQYAQCSSPPPPPPPPSPLVPIALQEEVNIAVRNSNRYHRMVGVGVPVQAVKNLIAIETSMGCTAGVDAAVFMENNEDENSDHWLCETQSSQNIPKRNSSKLDEAEFDPTHDEIQIIHLILRVQDGVIRPINLSNKILKTVQVWKMNHIVGNDAIDKTIQRIKIDQTIQRCKYFEENFHVKFEKSFSSYDNLWTDIETKKNNKISLKQPNQRSQTAGSAAAEEEDQSSKTLSMFLDTDTEEEVEDDDEANEDKVIKRFVSNLQEVQDQDKAALVAFKYLKLYEKNEHAIETKQENPEYGNELEWFLSCKEWSNKHEALMKRAKLIEAWVAFHGASNSASAIAAMNAATQGAPTPPWAKLPVLKFKKNNSSSSTSNIPPLPLHAELVHWYKTKIVPYECSCGQAFETPSKFYSHKGLTGHT